MRNLHSSARAHRRSLVHLLTAGSALFLLSACGSDPEEVPQGGAEVGKTYLLDIPGTNWTPADVGADVGEYVPQFLINVESMANGSIQLLMGTANAGVQEMCNPTSSVTAVGNELSSFVAGPMNFPLYIINRVEGAEPVAAQTQIYNFTMTDVLPDGSGTANGSIAVMMDIREIYPLFTQIISVNPDKVCDALMQLGSACEPCLDGALYCLNLTANLLESTETQTVITPVGPASTLGAECQSTPQTP